MQHHFYHFSDLYLIRLPYTSSELAEYISLNQLLTSPLDATHRNLVRITMNEQLYRVAHLPNDFITFDQFNQIRLDSQPSVRYLMSEYIDNVWRTEKGRVYLNDVITLIKGSDEWSGVELEYLNDLMQIDKLNINAI